MNARQLEKWERIRTKGRQRYLLEQTLFWGSLLSVAEITRAAFHFVIARLILDTTFQAIHLSENRTDQESVVVRFITSEIIDVGGCFLLAGFIALAVWTYREQLYFRNASWVAAPPRPEL